MVCKDNTWVPKEVLIKPKKIKGIRMRAVPNQETSRVRILWHKAHVRKTVLTAYSTPRRAKKWKKVVREPANPAMDAAVRMLLSGTATAHSGPSTAAAQVCWGPGWRPTAGSLVGSASVTVVVTRAKATR